MGMLGVVFVTDLKLYNTCVFDCALANFIWRVMQITFGLSKPTNIKHVFGGWVQRMNDKDRKLLLVGVGAMVWSIWFSRNDIIFNKTSILSYM
jgi:hypothetical protein